jgi:membrane protease YdiL (CAAX protease family)
MIKSILFNSLVHLAILIPLFVVAWRSTRNKAPFFALGWFAAIYIICNLLQSVLSQVVFFEGQQYNLVGKSAVLLFLVICCFIIRGYNRKDFGISAPNWEKAETLLFVCSVYVLLRTALYMFSGEASTGVHSETILFQATLPGMQEELLFRGLLLGLLNSIFIANWTIVKVKFGWGAIITSVLFGLTHAISPAGNFSIHFEPLLFLRTAFEGFLFALLVQKTKSIVPAIIYHNLLNLISNH